MTHPPARHLALPILLLCAAMIAHAPAQAVTLPPSLAQEDALPDFDLSYFLFFRALPIARPLPPTSQRHRVDPGPGPSALTPDHRIVAMIAAGHRARRPAGLPGPRGADPVRLLLRSPFSSGMALRALFDLAPDRVVPGLPQSDPPDVSPAPPPAPPPAPVPLPAGAVLSLSALAALGLLRRRRR